MRVGVDGSCWANRRGFGRFTRALVTALVEAPGEHRIHLLLDSVSAVDEGLPPVPDGLTVDVAPVRTAPARAASADGSRSVTDVVRMGWAASRAGYDVMLFPASYSYFPVLGTPVVTVFHDAIAESLPGLVLPDRRARARWGAKQWVALHQSRAVLTVSEASRAALRERLRVPADRLRVIREAPDPHFRPVSPEVTGEVLARYGVDPGTPYVIYVGGISPHKNLGVLVEAFGRLRRTDAQLLLVGDTSEDPFLSATGDVRRAVDASPARERIRLLGYVPDPDLPALYAGAVLSAQPSLAEGYGLTAAESVACGTPVLASRDPALVELLGSFGTYADPHSPAEWAARLEELLDHPDRIHRLSNEGLATAETWTWQEAARTTVSVLVEAAGR